LTDAAITSYRLDVNELASTAPSVTFTLSCAALQMGYQTADGKQQAVTGWDLLARTGAGSLDLPSCAPGDTKRVLTINGASEWIDSLSWGLQQGAVAAPGATLKDLGDIEVSAAPNLQSPGLFLALASGQPLDQVVYTDSSGLSGTLQLKLFNVGVESYGYGPGPVETFGLKFTRVEVSYRSSYDKEDVRTSWDVQTGKGQGPAGADAFDAGTPALRLGPEPTNGGYQRVEAIDFGSGPITLDALSWALASPPRPGARLQLGELQVTTPVEAVSPELVLALATGHVIKEVRVKVEDGGGDDVAWDLKGVELTSYQFVAREQSFALAYESADLVTAGPDGQGNLTVATLHLGPTPAGQTGGPPSVALQGAPGSSPEGTLISLTSAVSDAGNSAVSYAWQVSRDGAAYASGDGPELTFTPDDEGSYDVTLTVTTAGGSASVGTSIIVTNVAPQDVTVQGPAAGVTGQTLSYSGSYTDPGTADPHTLTWQVLDEIGNVVATGSGPDFTFTPARAGKFLVIFKVDDGTDTAEAGEFVTVANAPPQANAGGPYRIAEGGSLTLDASDSSDPDGDPLTFSWDVNGDGTPDAAGVNPTLSWQQLHALGIQDGTYMVTLTVQDDHGHTVTASVPLTVDNVVPVAQLTGPAAAVRGQPVTFAGTFTDPGEEDFAHPQAWQVFDASGGVVAQGSGAGFTFAAPQSGTYRVVYTVTDDDGAQGSASQPLTVTAVALQPDPLDPSKTALVVGGTAGPDRIIFRPKHHGVEALVNGASLGVFHPTGRLIAYGQAGDDFIQVQGNITLPTLLDGGDGNDTLVGGRGDNVLVGGAGDDVLIGGRGRNLLIGGMGRDRLVGGPGDDLLIGGTTAFDANAVALSALLAEWSAPASPAERVADLRGTGTGAAFGARLNGAYFLKADGPDRTVFGDGSANVLNGGSGLNWYFAQVGGAVPDLLVGRKKGRIVDPLA
jgi:PKD repeat protein/type VI protein secretion system component Hcp